MLVKHKGKRPAKTRRVKRASRVKRVRRVKDAERKPYTTTDGASQTLLSKWVHCRQAARYYLDGWRQPTTKESLAFGGLVHEILECLYKRIRARQMPTNPRGRAAFLARQTDAWRKKALGWTSPAEAQTVELCIAKAAAVFPGYCEMWAADFDPRIWRELEGVFDVDWRGYRLRGRIDAVREVDGKLWVLETKTMGRIDGSLDDALSFDFQTLFYVTAAEVALGRPVEGAIYNVVRRPGHKLKDDEALPTYTRRVAEEAAKKPDHFYKRFELTFAPDARRAFEDELAAKMIAFEDWIKNGGPTWRDEASCRGRWSCDWLPACASGSMAGYMKDGTVFGELR